MLQLGHRPAGNRCPGPADSHSYIVWRAVGALSGENMTLKKTGWLALSAAAVGCVDTAPVTITIPTGTLTFSTIVSSLSHTCALTPSGAAYCWGVNTAGKLGDGTTTDRYAPTAVGGGLTFTSIAAGHSTTCGLVA